MKHFIRYFVLLCVIALSACTPEENDLFTTVRIGLETSENVIITRVQAQVQLTNVNTRQIVTAVDFEGAQASVEVLRGAYQVDIEGVATCQMTDGSTVMRQFRCHSDYEEFLDVVTNSITLNIIFLD